jgi:glycosyltransferase XagB
MMIVPPTTDPSWDAIWRAWDENPKAYWWHEGRRARLRDLPPKKTRQLIYAFYQTAKDQPAGRDFLVNYIDADSCPPPDHFLSAVAGMRRYDVLQAQNVAGNLNATLAASWHAFDHMAWDGGKYAHLSADGKQPYWVLGKGLFLRASDLLALGGFHPWITIEDPEVGMRFWKNGRRLGVIQSSLIEEVPQTFARGVTQRKRWVCGFFQSLGEPLDRLGFTPLEKLRAWMNFLPCLSLWVNAVGFPMGVWALWQLAVGSNLLPVWGVVLAGLNVTAFMVSMGALYLRTWARTALVLETRRARLAYMLRINPLFVAIWWVMWLAPLAIGLWMHLRDRGLVWERTEKTNANRELIEVSLGGGAHKHAA